jgi:hypothetical protein
MLPSSATEEEKREFIKRKARLLEAKLSGKPFSENEPYVPQSGEALDKLRKRLQHETPDPKELPFKNRIDARGKIPTSSPESHEKKKSPILERSKDADYFLESVNNRLEDLRNEIVELERSVERKTNELKQEVISVKNLVRLALRRDKKGR